MQTSENKLLTEMCISWWPDSLPGGGMTSPSCLPHVISMFIDIIISCVHCAAMHIFFCWRCNFNLNDDHNFWHT